MYSDRHTRFVSSDLTSERLDLVGGDKREKRVLQNYPRNVTTGVIQTACLFLVRRDAYTCLWRFCFFFLYFFFDDFWFDATAEPPTAIPRLSSNGESPGIAVARSRHDREGVCFSREKRGLRRVRSERAHDG